MHLRTRRKGYNEGGKSMAFPFTKFVSLGVTA